MSQLVVTTGKRYSDIDGLACVIAYREIPREKPLAVIYGPLNTSITATIIKWPLNYLTDIGKGDYRFVVTDISEANEFPPFVKKERVIEIYDHHFGFEKYWRDRLGEKAKIEPVGACATLIWEEFKRNNRTISTLSANLLYTAIISNTLNFQASITANRDKTAFSELKKFIDLPNEWVARYYQDQEVTTYTNPTQAISNDTKIQIIKGMKCAIAQIELWNGKDFIKEHQNEIESALRGFGTEYWFFTSPSIGESRNYIFTKSETIKNLLRHAIEIDFFGTDVGVTKKLWLRKEILKMIQ